jgi:hypothetical protein
MLIFRDEKDNQILKFYTEEVEDKSIRIFSTEKNPEYYTKVYDENDQLIDEFHNSNLRDRVYYFKGYTIKNKNK